MARGNSRGACGGGGIQWRRLAAAALAVLAAAALCDAVVARAGRYEEGAPVEFYVNTVGPYSNPGETYSFYSLPYCQPDTVVHKTASLGEVLEGGAKASSLYDLKFRTPIQWQSLCQLTLSNENITKFRDAISRYYYFEMFYDDLPVWGFVGSVVNEDDGAAAQHYLFKHLHFTILYNDDQIIKINCTADTSKVVLLEADATDLKVEFSYSAEWHPTDWPFSRRMELYRDTFFPQELEIHWLSIMNSCVLVALLTGFLAVIIMRVLKSDYARYSRADEDEDDDADYGWKLIHGDVFRFPPCKSLFAAFIGLGGQLLATATGVLLLSLVGTYYPSNGGSMYTSLICLYALTSVVGGYISGSFYKKMDGDGWAWNIVLEATLFVVPFFCVVLFVNSVAWYHHATAALPFTTMLVVLAIYIVVGFPLSVLGGIAGRHSAGPFDAPVRTKNFAREIPAVAWYRRWYTQMLMSGFLPFSAIYIELFYVFSSVWGHSTFQLFGILCIVFAILIVVTACITIALTYFQLSMEDHRWWWSSFMCGGSVAIFIYLYAIFFYVYRSKMSGFLQGSLYFGYMLVICYFFFIMLGTVGFVSCLVFIRRIYKGLHTD